jgi:hypothetical protein
MTVPANRDAALAQETDEWQAFDDRNGTRRTWDGSAEEAHTNLLGIYIRLNTLYSNDNQKNTRSCHVKNGHLTSPETTYQRFLILAERENRPLSNFIETARSGIQNPTSMPTTLRWRKFRRTRP